MTNSFSVATNSLVDCQDWILKTSEENFVTTIPLAVAALVVSGAQIAFSALQLVGAFLAGSVNLVTNLLCHAYLTHPDPRKLLAEGGTNLVSGLAGTGCAIANICSAGIFSHYVKARPS